MEMEQKLEKLNRDGMTHFQSGNIADALTCFKQMLRIQPIPDVYNHIATCYVTLRQYKAAEIALNLSLKMASTDATHFAMGNLFFYRKQYEKSIFHYHQMSVPGYNLAFPHLALGQFKIGFAIYESRLETNEISAQTKERTRVDIPFIPYWRNEPYQHLLILYEQGIGDNIQYFRFILDLARKFPERKITYFCKHIGHLFKEYPNINVVLQLSTNLFDYKIYIMSLPFYLGVDILPLQENYLRSFPSPPLRNKRKIGFAYKGLLTSFIEKNIPLNEWDIFSDLDIDLYCFATETGPFLPVKDTVPFCNSMGHLAELDLFITVDTAIAHIAGVMQVPTWLLLGYGSDWRWTQPWYPSLEIIQMEKNVDMKELLPRVKRKLEFFLKL